MPRGPPEKQNNQVCHNHAHNDVTTVFTILSTIMTLPCLQPCPQLSHNHIPKLVYKYVYHRKYVYQKLACKNTLSARQCKSFDWVFSPHGGKTNIHNRNQKPERLFVQKIGISAVPGKTPFSKAQLCQIHRLIVLQNTSWAGHLKVGHTTHMTGLCSHAVVQHQTFG
ncbi:hypothetical protein METBIDRAFT_171217 [Metschnikowia bicuspidata var. bicuspidata NRRL YB-4993]|uniref:Uncharacterized protein n=1 Tax=Metschnikowia bicuspidata var. bicuspidata NRRL YB-4993 TaxID=869754 RepID=A0A1A0HA64_9ASCO|nr:hypothetical protein METBIDRAFT_171217 [Metschnikowia bicuspidata var. bicuspidata NRRL YB-4993]OBA21019.1 hypothetical protein METBIDRAFT_171217 [Metschnikowia bicuspidata var. bicuspidata NRRL YB-4993]